MLVELFKKLAATSSTNQKLEMLRSLEGDDKGLVKSIFLYTYSPRVNYYIKKLGDFKEGTKDLESDLRGDSESDFERLLIDLNERKVTGKSAASYLKSVFEQYNKDSQDLMTKVILRDLRCGITDTQVNKVWPNYIPSFEVQLANTFEPSKPREKSYFVSRKMDGLRGVFIPFEGLFTRQGKRIIGFEDTIEKELQDFSDKNGGIALDGELFSTSIPFEEIQGAVMTNKNIDPEIKKQVKFFVFAAVKDFWKQVAFDSTQEMLNVISGIKGNYLELVETKEIKVEEVDSVHDKFTEEGFEGIMLRHPKISYEFKRGNCLLKFKKFLESDFEVVGFFEGNGKNVGKLGGLLVSGEVDGKKISSEVGSGFSDEQRVEFFSDWVKGKTVEIKYQGITPEGSLRFPVFLKFKLDR